MGKKLLLITDIPSPYRIHFFNALNQELLTQGIAFEVLFMARTVPIRFWELDDSEYMFPYRIVSGIHPRYKNDVYHFNPGILWSVLKDKPTWVLIGGAWNMPTVISLLLTSFLRRGKVCTILWSEANYNSMINKKGLIPRIRSSVVRRVDAFAVPGRVAEETVMNYWRVPDKPFLPLPNLVNEKLFRDKVLLLRYKRKELRHQRNLNDDDLVLLWPARLHEETKGLINFLKAVEEIIPPKVKILIAGEGQDRARIEEWLAVSPLKGVSLLGQQSEQKMVELYALSDMLLLPSFRDPNPLSVIEGLWSGLPLFISYNCGNWPEAVEQGKNGWLIDPASISSIQSAFRDMLSRTSLELSAYGDFSLALAEQKFATKPSVTSFVDAILNFPKNPSKQGVSR